MASEAIRVDLGDMAPSVERHLRDGDYASIEAVLLEGVRALDREKAAFDAMVRVKIQEALDDPRPSFTPEEAFAELDRRSDVRRLVLATASVTAHSRSTI